MRPEREGRRHEPSSAVRRPASGSARARRAASVALLGALSLTSAACYRYVPLEAGSQAGPQAGTIVELQLNDRGRAALADSIGPAADRIEGTLRSASGGAYQLSVSSVRYFGGTMNKWSGESLRVPMEFVGRSRERRFDRKRTWAVGAGAAAALVLAILQTELTGGSTPRPTPVPPPPVGNQ